VTTDQTPLDLIVDRVVDRVGTDVTMAVPLGLGKPVNLLNAFYRRACRNSGMSLTIITALTLRRPEPDSDLERRLAEPIYERLFGNYPAIDYAEDRRKGEVPDNVSVKEFYLNPGKELGNPSVQQQYISSNYTHVVRDAIDHGVNVVAQLITPSRSLEKRDGTFHSLSCNSDLTFDMLDALDRAESVDSYCLLGEINSNLPFMYGDALVKETRFDDLHDPETSHQLFSMPSESVGDTAYAIGLHASRLVRDGGTLQVGIGSLSDALTRMLILRENDNNAYRDMIDQFDYPTETPDSLADEIGGHTGFDEGLYAATEMFVRGFAELYRHGILRREVFGNETIQQYVNENDGDTSITMELVDQLVESGRIDATVSRADLKFLKVYGIIKDKLTLEDGDLVLADGTAVKADLSHDDTRERLASDALGESLKSGSVAHAGFFLGPPSLYQFFRSLDETERRAISMERISFVNQLYGKESLKRSQRKDARFINIAMKVTLSGAVVSDGLEDMRVVSGVGGQYNFVAMAHELDDGRSIIMLPSTRESQGELESNIVWNYGHTTIPRHLRDIVVTEYGIADLRGKSDRKVIEELLSVTDARFQEDLVQKAKNSGKLPEDWSLPEQFRHNRPEKITGWTASVPDRTGLEPFPFGSEVSEKEFKIGRSLRGLQSDWAANRWSVFDFSALVAALNEPKSVEPFLQRMGLETTDSWSEYIYRKVLVYALARDGNL
jgi:acyl-CoA hydrolase